MLEQHTRVIQNFATGVWVEAIEPEGCGVCAGQGCASRRIAELFQRGPRKYQVESQPGLSPGDKVIIGVPDGGVLRGALYLYGMPLILILGGTLLAQIWFPGDTGSVAGAAAGGVLAGMIIRLMPQQRRPNAQPIVMRRAYHG